MRWPIVRQAWFDRSLSLKAMTGFLFLRAGTGKGAKTYARELAERFKWSRQTAGKVIIELMGCGLVEKNVMRGRNGAFDGTTYRPKRQETWPIWATVKKRCSGSPCNREACSTRKERTSHEKKILLEASLPIALPPAQMGSYTEQSSAPTFDVEVAALALGSPKLLGFEMDKLPLDDFIANAGSELEAIAEVCSDADLRARVRARDPWAGPCRNRFAGRVVCGAGARGDDRSERRRVWR